jgi:hypothetical protein
MWPLIFALSQVVSATAPQQPWASPNCERWGVAGYFLGMDPEGARTLVAPMQAPLDTSYPSRFTPTALPRGAWSARLPGQFQASLVFEQEGLVAARVEFTKAGDGRAFRVALEEKLGVPRRDLLDVDLSFGHLDFTLGLDQDAEWRSDECDATVLLKLRTIGNARDVEVILLRTSVFRRASPVDVLIARRRLDP